MNRFRRHSASGDSAFGAPASRASTLPQTEPGHAGPALSAMLDGELSAAEEAQVQAHLVSCASCRSELDTVRLVRSWVRALPPVDPPFGFLERLAQPYRTSRRRVAIATVGAAAAVVATVLGVTPPGGPDDTGPGAGNLATATVTTLWPSPSATLVSARQVAGADHLFEPLAPATRPGDQAP